MSLAGALASLRAPPTTEEPDTICAVAIRDLYATGRQAKRYEAIRVEFLVTQAGQGSTPAASAALQLLAQIEQAADAESHRARLADPDPLAVARYLGEIGTTEDQLREMLGRHPTKSERDERDKGATARVVETRALALSRLRRGTAKAEEWMGR